MSASLLPARRDAGDVPLRRLPDPARLLARLPRRWGAALRLQALAFLLALGVAAGTAHLIRHEYDEALATTTREIGSVALILAHQAERTLEAVEVVQRAILDRLGPVETPQQFRDALRGVDVHLDLRRRLANLPQVDAITTIDADGNLINFSRYWPIPQVNIADRDYYKALRANPALGTFVSVPVRNRGTGTWTSYLARSVVGPEGEFLGLILVGLELRHFEVLYEKAGLNPEASVALFRDDGVLLARHPHIEPDAAPLPRLQEAMRRARAAGGRDSYVYESPQALDGRARLVAVFPLQRYPLGVAVTASREEALAPWRPYAISLAGAGLLLELAIGGIGLLVARQLRAQRELAEAHMLRSQAEIEMARAVERAEAARAARALDERYALALDSMSQGLCMFDAEHRLAMTNRRFQAMFRLAPGALAPGMSHAAVLERILASALPGGAAVTQELQERIAAFLDDGSETGFIQDHPDGRAWSVSLVPGRHGGWVATFEDVTERRRAEAQVAYLARHDALTGLPNRVLFRERLDMALARARRGGRFALLCLDLDRFKLVNDTLGHPTGDALLRAVTERLRSHCRPTDTISRLGGDEFAIIHDGPEAPHHAAQLAARLIEALGEPFLIDGHEISIGTSIGIAMIPQDGADATALMKKADLALYQAKRERGTWCFFSPAMESEAEDRRALESALRGAAAEGGFELYYQPILDLHSRRLVGFEALLRWHHPARGMVSPAEFIPLAEETGLILQIDAWVLRRACAEAMRWPEGLCVSVNLSPLNFQGEGPAAMVRAVLDATGLPPSRLELEITESTRLDAGGAVLGMMQALKALGVRLAMDDLGSGHSALNYLRSLPFDTVKIDKSFVADVTRAEKSRAIIEAVGSLCQRIGVATTVEGVETEAQLAELQHSPCTNAQGYLFGRPRPAGEVPEICRRLLHHPAPLPELAAAAE